MSHSPDEDTLTAFVDNNKEGYCLLDVPGKANAAAGPIFVTENAAIYSLFNNCIFILSHPYNKASPSSCEGFDLAHITWPFLSICADRIVSSLFGLDLRRRTRPVLMRAEGLSVVKVTAFPSPSTLRGV